MLGRQPLMCARMGRMARVTGEVVAREVIRNVVIRR